MAQRLARKLRAIFVWQTLIAVVVIVAGTYAASVVVREQLVQQWLKEEAHGYWQSRVDDPQQRAPNTGSLRGVFYPAAALADRTGPAFRLGEGFHKTSDNRTVYVDDQPQGRLVLSYDRTWLDKMTLWLLITPLLLALLAITAALWITYRTARQVIDPLSELARDVGKWNPEDPDQMRLLGEQMSAGTTLEGQELIGALQRMGARIRAFMRRERDFTRDASHELRTPLTVIRVATDMLDGVPDMPRLAMRSVDRIRRATTEMEHLIDGFLMLAREDNVAPQMDDVDVRDVVHERVALVQPLLEGKDVRLVVNASEPLVLHTAPKVLGLMVGHLLANAARFTDHGSIDVTVGQRAITIRDTGIGMDAQTLRQAMEPFYRADIAQPDAKGMGLAVVQRLGERFGWPVELESRPGEGTTARIRFPGA